MRIGGKAYGKMQLHKRLRKPDYPASLKTALVFQTGAGTGLATDVSEHAPVENRQFRASEGPHSMAILQPRVDRNPANRLSFFADSAITMFLFLPRNGR